MFKRIIHFLILTVFIFACTPATETPPTEAPAPEQPPSTPVPEKSPEIEEPPLPVIPSVRDQHPYNWQPEDVKGLDMWGDSESDTTDIIAIYQREMDGVFEFRLDILNFESDELSPIYFAVDFLDGGSTQISAGSSMTFEIEWDLMVSVIAGEFKMYDADFTELSDQILTSEINKQLDFVFFSISESAFAEWGGDPFQMQALLLDSAHSTVLDLTTHVATEDTSGRGKLVPIYTNIFFGQTPDTSAWRYDGYAPFLTPGREKEREGDRRGPRYMLDATERYEIPITINDVLIDLLPAEEYMRILERFRFLADRGLLDLNMTLSYGHFMPWQPDDVDAKSIEIALEIREGLDLPTSSIFWPYEGMLTPGDIQVIKEAGFEAIYGDMRPRDSFFGRIDDFWSNPTAHKDEIEMLRKIHQFNGMKFFFHTEWPNYGPSGLMTDDRWKPEDWVGFSDEFGYFAGTDEGLHHFWRRVLHDMAMDPDQEQFFTVGTDMLYTSWLLPDVIDWNFQWLASHPWIEVTTFSSILDRDWEVIDHGEIDALPEKPLMRFPDPDANGDYLSYWPQHYYGGISDGHDPSVPAGTEIEAYYDYVPILRDGEMIPSGRIMGDDQTPGSIVYETLANLRKAPDNPIATIAWLNYFVKIGEQTYHEGAVLRGDAKSFANFMGQVNKIIEAAHWAAAAEGGAFGSDTEVYDKDLDLDGEMEYVMHNDQVFAIFENDGGRLEYAFAYDAEHGPIQLISPLNHYSSAPTGNYDPQNGELAYDFSLAWTPDGAFVEDIDSDGQFDYEQLVASIDGSSLTYSYETQPVSKTFTLEGDTLLVHYERDSGDSINVGVGATVNWLGIFEKDWVWNFEPIQTRDIIGWQMTTGGAVFLHVDPTYEVQTAAFIDSPAREEMQQREDVETYPEGHAMCFPCSSIRIWGTQEVDFSLTLRAAPINPETHSSQKTPTIELPDISPEVIEAGHIVYDDAINPGWSLDPWGGSADLASTTDVYQGSNVLEVTLEPDAAITFDNGSFDTTEYDFMVFYLNGGNTADQQLYVEMKSGNNTPLGKASVADYIVAGPLMPDEWHQVTIPMSALNPDHGPFAWFDIGDASGEGAATFFIDEIRFVTVEK